MKLSAFFLMLTIVNSNSALAAGFSDEIECYGDLIGKATGANFEVNGNVVLLPATRDGKRGFYAYTDSTAYFCQLPKPLGYSYLKLALAGKPVTYITYSDVRDDVGRPGMATSSEPLPANKGKYQNADCRDFLDKQSRIAFNEELKKRLATVAKHYYEDLATNRQDWTSEYKKAIEKCEKIEGLRGIAKLPSQSPSSSPEQGQGKAIRE